MYPILWQGRTGLYTLPTPCEHLANTLRTPCQKTPPCILLVCEKHHARDGIITGMDLVNYVLGDYCITTTLRMGCVPTLTI